MKKVITAFLAACMLCSIPATTAGAVTKGEGQAQITPGIIEITPFASSNMSGWTPLLSKTSYGASVQFVGSRSGTIKIELQNSSGTVVASFTETFSNKTNVAYTKSRTTASGTYRIVIYVTISGSTETRTSSYMNLL
jgi:hypothetical protein